LRARVLHALRDPRGDGGRLRRLPGARLLLKPGDAEGADWWATFFDEEYLQEYAPLFSLERDRREVARLLDLLGLPVGARVLDAACGQGRHAHLLAEAGLDVEAVDYSEALLARARERGTGPSLRYSRADMRALPAEWAGRFDAVVNLGTSFGFFGDQADDVAALREFARVLAPGGALLWEGASRDGVVARFLARDWWLTADGAMIAQERWFDPVSGVLCVESRRVGAPGGSTRTHQLRLYTATRLAELCTDVGLCVEQVYDGWRDRPLRRTSAEMVLLARKIDRASPPPRELPRRRLGH
jgi:ubiquinone/menaquinone biosynthesis C-methylase UbiE